MKHHSGFAIVLALCFMIYSCKPSKKNESGQMSDSMVVKADTTPVNEQAEFNFSYTIVNLPPPLQVIDELSKSDLPADVGLLNPVQHADEYHSAMKKAFNYGIYGIDLGYLVVEQRTPEMIRYYPVVKKLAGELDLAETFNRFVSRFENNKDNRDSLIRIIDEAYAATDSYLRTNERLKVASEVLAGSWIECQHICVNSLLKAERNQDTEALYDRVWQQRFFLENISKTLAEFKDDADLMKVKNDFDSLLAIYKEVHDSNGITKEFLAKLSENLKRVRDNIIS